MARQATKAKAKVPAKPAKRTVAVKPAAKSAPRPAAAVASTVPADALAAAAAALNTALSRDQIDAVPIEAVQQLMAAVIRAYSAKVQAEGYFEAFDPEKGRVSPTDVMIAASNILKAADLQVFELGMWQSFTGR